MEDDVFSLPDFRWLHEDIPVRTEDFQKRIPAEVPNSTIAWKPFWEDVKLLYAYAEEELNLTRGAVEEIIQRIHIVIQGQKGKPLHKLEREALKMADFIGWQAWSRRKHEYKTFGWDTPR